MCVQNVIRVYAYIMRLAIDARTQPPAHSLAIYMMRFQMQPQNECIRRGILFAHTSFLRLFFFSFTIFLLPFGNCLKLGIDVAPFPVATMVFLPFAVVDGSLDAWQGVWRAVVGVGVGGERVPAT